jgi:hypothetical protein
MRQLKYDRYGVQGLDTGSWVAPEIGKQDPGHVIGIHVNALLTFPIGEQGEMDGLTESLTRPSTAHHGLFETFELPGRGRAAARRLRGPRAGGPARARLLLAGGEPELARAVLRRHPPGDVCDLPSAPSVALAAQVNLSCGAVDEARDRTAQLEKLAAACDVPSVRGLAARSAARLAAATGDGDPVACFEAALVPFADAELTHDLACTRLELAELLAHDRPVGRAPRDAARWTGSGASEPCTTSMPPRTCSDAWERLAGHGREAVTS